MQVPGTARIRLLWRVVLLAMAFVTPGCGPETYNGRFLVSWSPDGSHAAAAPNLTDDIETSGIWVFDVPVGQARQILAVNDGSYCLHPQWSPFSDEILFATVAKDEEETKNPTDRCMPYSVWLIRADGYGLRKIADACSIETTGDFDFPRIALPNMVAWGAEPGTVIFQTAKAGKVTALLFDPYTGRITECLPHPADAYSLEPSPSRRKVAVALYNGSTGTAEVFLSDFGFDNWRSLATIRFDADQLDAFSAMIYWAPDSSSFILTEEDYGPELEEEPQHFLRLFDADTGRSRRVALGNPNTRILWDSGSRYFFFSGKTESHESSTIFRVDTRTGRSIPLALPPGDNYLVSWNQANERIYFYNRFVLQASGGSGKLAVRRLLSCASDGSDIRDAGPWTEDDDVIWSSSPDGSRLLTTDPLPVLEELSGSGIDLRDPWHSWQTDPSGHLEGSSVGQSLAVTGTSLRQPPCPSMCAMGHSGP